VFSTESKIVHDQTLRSLQESKLLKSPKIHAFNRRKKLAFSRLGVINEVQSSIPSHMKHFSTLDVKMDGLLRVKGHTIVFTGQQKSSNSNEKPEEEQIASSNHITILE